MGIRVVAVLVFLFMGLRLHAQEDTIRVGEEIDFLLFLTEQKQMNDADYYSEKLAQDTLRYPAGFRDTLHFICAEAYNKYKNPQRAIPYYDKVSDASVFFYPAAFTSALLEAENKKYAAAFAKIRGIPYDDRDYFTDLKHFELSGTSLLVKDYATFDSIQSFYHPYDSTLQAEYEYLKQYRYLLQAKKKKSAFLAGTLSALVPGLGKVYTGKPGQGLAAFLKTVPLAAITIENYRTQGFNNPQLYIFGSLFALFYVGNIWGSSLSANIVYQEKIDEIHHNIVVGLRVPVDRLFR